MNASRPSEASSTVTSTRLACFEASRKDLTNRPTSAAAAPGGARAELGLRASTTQK